MAPLRHPSDLGRRERCCLKVVLWAWRSMAVAMGRLRFFLLSGPRHLLWLMPLPHTGGPGLCTDKPARARPLQAFGGFTVHRRCRPDHTLLSWTRGGHMHDKGWTFSVQCARRGGVFQTPQGRKAKSFLSCTLFSLFYLSSSTEEKREDEPCTIPI